MNDDDDKDVPDSSRAPCQTCCDATQPTGWRRQRLQRRLPRQQQTVLLIAAAAVETETGRCWRHCYCRQRRPNCCCFPARAAVAVAAAVVGGGGGGDCWMDRLQADCQRCYLRLPGSDTVSNEDCRGNNKTISKRCLYNRDDGRSVGRTGGQMDERDTKAVIHVPHASINH